MSAITQLGVRLTPLRVPVRADLLGGWTDQAAWEALDEPGAVLSFSLGWDTETGDYPLWLDERGDTLCDVRGQGTGLGLSQIIPAAKYLQSHRCRNWRAYTDHSVDVEQPHTQGGWQDAPGALLPGWKLLTKEPGQPLQVTYLPRPALEDHLVLFDTRTRRDGGTIGDRVRTLLVEDSPTADDLREILQASRDAAVQWAVSLAQRPDDVEDLAYECVSRWRRLSDLMPEMRDMWAPEPFDLAYGHKLLGAGGGGYGLYFAREPELRPRIIAALREVGLWATVPVSLPGVQAQGSDGTFRSLYQGYSECGA